MKDNIKNIIMIVLILLIVVLVSIIGFLLFRKSGKILEITGTIIVADKDYVIFENKSEDYLVSNIKGEYKIGDIVKFAYKESDLNEKENPKKLVIIEEELIETKEIKDNVNDSNINNSTENNTNKNDNVNNNISSNPKPNNGSSNGGTSNNQTQVKPNTNGSKNPDSEVLSYFNSLNNDFSASKVKDSVKSGFITVVDFLFYNGKIKGYTFKELSDSAKLKVLSMALYFDNKIDKYFPGYKESISNTTNKIYTNVKNEIVKAYLELTTTICSKNNDLCKEAKEGFSDLKNTFSLSWALIKDIASDGISSLKNWYEIWSGK